MSAPDPSRPLRVLALEPWLGGSHRAFLEALRRGSRHQVEVCGLPARHWKWRMRAGAWDLARQVAGRERPDVLLVSDYLDLPAFLGFAPQHWAGVPVALYMHENQLTYPTRKTGPKPDTSYGFINILSCVRAELILFNSNFHREQFTDAARELLQQVPRHRPLQEFEAAIEASLVIFPGVELDDIEPGRGNRDGPLRILFPHRWEHDKDPLGFLEAILELRQLTPSFELVLLGEQYAELPPGVAPALGRLQAQVVQHGFLSKREQYIECLRQCDVVVSTAQHEFFGIAIAEALAAGLEPLLPNRLSYPELLGESLASTCLYDSGSALVQRLAVFANAPAALRLPEQRARLAGRALVASQRTNTPQLDRVLEELVRAAGERAAQNVPPVRGPSS